MWKSVNCVMCVAVCTGFGGLVGTYAATGPVEAMQREAVIRGYGEMYYTGTVHKFRWFSHQVDTQPPANMRLPYQ